MHGRVAGTLKALINRGVSYKLENPLTNSPSVRSPNIDCAVVACLQSVCLRNTLCDECDLGASHLSSIKKVCALNTFLCVI